MAHTSDGNGPFPDKAGEFCGNHLNGRPAILVDGTSREDGERQLRVHLSMMRFGKPASTPAGTSEEMAELGYVGLYLKEDRKLYSWETAIETDVLTEAVVSADQPEGSDE
jgi:hypothetical protein